MSSADKFIQVIVAIALFGGVMATLLFATSRVQGRVGRSIQIAAFVVPALALIAFGLIFPAIQTAQQSFQDSASVNYVGFDNYVSIFTNDSLRRTLLNTAAWVLIAPIAATAIGLIYAILIDNSRFEKFAKALMFLPMAISLVGASLIWKFVYSFKATEQVQIGLLNEILKSLGLGTYDFLATPPWNVGFEIIIMIWVQAGFAMTVLSAAIKAIPDDMIEAARLDGASSMSMFRHITVPSIRPSLIVVLTTISIATLKVFDIVRTTTGGRFDDSVIANEFITQRFTQFQNGIAATLAMLLFVLVIPIVVYNVRQMRKLEAR